jgi:hypothetical protein
MGSEQADKINAGKALKLKPFFRRNQVGALNVQTSLYYSAVLAAIVNITTDIKDKIVVRVFLDKKKFKLRIS